MWGVAADFLWLPRFWLCCEPGGLSDLHLLPSIWPRPGLQALALGMCIPTPLRVPPRRPQGPVSAAQC